MKEEPEIIVLPRAGNTRPQQTGAFDDDSDDGCDVKSDKVIVQKANRLKRSSLSEQLRRDDFQLQETGLAQKKEYNTLQNNPKNERKDSAPKVKTEPQSMSTTRHHPIKLNTGIRSTKGVNMNRLRELLGKKEQIPNINEGRQNSTRRGVHKTSSRLPLQQSNSSLRYEGSSSAREIRVSHAPVDHIGDEDQRQTSNGASMKRFEVSRRGESMLHTSAKGAEPSVRNIESCRGPGPPNPRKESIQSFPRDQTTQNISKRSTNGASRPGNEPSTTISTTSSTVMDIEGSVPKKPSLDISGLGNSLLKRKRSPPVMARKQPESQAHDQVSGILSGDRSGAPENPHFHRLHDSNTPGWYQIASDRSGHLLKSIGNDAEMATISNNSNSHCQYPGVSGKAAQRVPGSQGPILNAGSSTKHVATKRNLEQISGGLNDTGPPMKKATHEPALRRPFGLDQSGTRSQITTDSLASEGIKNSSPTSPPSQYQSIKSQAVFFDDAKGNEGDTSPKSVTEPYMVAKDSILTERLDHVFCPKAVSPKSKDNGNIAGRKPPAKQSVHLLTIAPVQEMLNITPNAPQSPSPAASSISNAGTAPIAPRLDSAPSISTVVTLPLTPPLSKDAEPFFEFSIFHRIWTEDQKESDITPQELTCRPFTCLEEANSWAEKYFARIRDQYEQHFAVHFSEQNITVDGHGCYVITGAFSRIEHPAKKLHLKVFVQRDYVSEIAGVTPQQIKHTIFVSKTVYVLRLMKLIEFPLVAPESDSDEKLSDSREVEADSDCNSDSDSDSDLSSECSSEYEKKLLKKADKKRKNRHKQEKGKVTEEQMPVANSSLRLHCTIPCAEIYTTLEAANAAAKGLQIELSHEREPKSLQQVYQNNDAIKLSQKLTTLNEDNGLWRSEFKSPGRNSSTFELVVEKTTLCGPRNL